MSRRQLAKARILVADQINMVLEKMSSFDADRYKYAKYEKETINEIFGRDLFWLDADLDQNDHLMGGTELIILNPNAEPKLPTEVAEVCWPLDTSTVIRKEAGEDAEGACYLFERIRTISPQEARGHAQYFAPKMVRLCFAKIFDNGSWYSESNIAGLFNDRWRLVDRNLARVFERGGRKTLTHTMMDNERIRRETHDTIAMSMSLALSRRYVWHVALGPTRDGTRILLPTNPAGCLAFFKNRERDANRLRRAALRHWVMRHYRNSDALGLTFVREHLRGHTEFAWSDLACEIFVSAFDLEKNEAFRLEAEQWRSQRKHNSVIVRRKKA